MPKTAHQTEAQWFRALSDPTRLQIVCSLATGERCVCDLTDSLDAAQSRLSFHLKVLKDAGLIEDRREGRWMYYSVRPEALARMGEFLESLKPRTRRLRLAGCCG